MNADGRGFSSAGWGGFCNNEWAGWAVAKLKGVESGALLSQRKFGLCHFAPHVFKKAGALFNTRDIGAGRAGSR